MPFLATEVENSKPMDWMAITHNYTIFKCMVDKDKEISDSAIKFANGLIIGLTKERVQGYIKNISTNCADIDIDREKQLKKIFSEIPYVLHSIFFCRFRC